MMPLINLIICVLLTLVLMSCVQTSGNIRYSDQLKSNDNVGKVADKSENTIDNASNNSTDNTTDSASDASDSNSDNNELTKEDIEQIFQKEVACTDQFENAQLALKTIELDYQLQPNGNIVSECKIQICNSGYRLAIKESTQEEYCKQQKRVILVSGNLNSDAEVDSIKSVITSGKALGFNGIVLGSVWLSDSMYTSGQGRNTRLKAIKAFCDENGFTLTPRITSPGYDGASWNTYTPDYGTAAAYPVKDSVYKYVGGQLLKLDSSFNVATPIYQNSFDSVNASGYFATSIDIDHPLKVTHLDSVDYYSAPGSVRFDTFTYLNAEGVPQNTAGLARLSKLMDVKPFTNYKISFWYKVSDDFAADIVKFHTSVYMTEKAQYLTIGSKSLSTPLAKVWTQVYFEINTLEYNKLRPYVGIWGGKSGKMWIDDLKVEESHDLQYVVRRNSTPIRVTNNATGVEYVEGVDYSIIKSSANNVYPTTYSFNVIPAGAIQENDILKLSYYRAYDWQMASNMALEAYNQNRKAMYQKIYDAIQPETYLVAVDEIRQGGYDELEMTKSSMGEILGDFINSQYDAIKDINLDIDVVFSADMLTPYQNAVDYYYMTRAGDGGYENSWQFVKRPISVQIWDGNSDSMRHFNEINFLSPIVSVCLDSYAGSAIQSTLQSYKDKFDDNYRGYQNIDLAYYTWSNKYGNLEAFANMFWRSESGE